MSVKPIIYLLLLFASSALKAQDILPLSEAIALGLQNNYSIQIARNEASIPGIANPGYIGLLPEISVFASQNNAVNDSRQSFFSGEEREKSNAASGNLNTGVALDWTLFDGFRMFASLDQWDELEKLGELNARIQIEQTIADVIGTYYDIVQQQQRVGVLHNAIEISSERKAFAEAAYNLGSGSGLNVLQASVDIHADSSALLQEEYLLLDASTRLNELLRRSPETIFRVEDTIPVSRGLQIDSLAAAVASRNPQLEAARKSSRISELNVKQARAASYPTIKAGMGYNYAASESETGLLQSSRMNGLNYEITASWPIFNGLRNRKQLAVAKVENLISQQELQQTGQQVQADLYRTFTNYSSSLSRAELERQSVEVARQNAEVAAEKMRLGSINSLELREAQRNLVDAEFRLILARYEAKLAETELLRLSGQLLN